MRISLIFLFFLHFICFGQSSGKLWVDVGLKGDIGKRFDWGFQLTNRFGDELLETNFIQASMRYKVWKYFRASVDYRGIFDKDDFGNYTFSNRINLNGEVRFSVKRLVLSSRARYQFGFSTLNDSGYDAEFDQAVRIKPEISYNIKNFFFNPSVSIDLFFDPMKWPNSSFVRYRLFVGGDFNLKESHEIGVGYLLDQQVNIVPFKRRHIATMSYTYTIGKTKKKKKN